MARAVISRECPTDYERAVCYYTLPRVVTPLTNGLVVAYAVVILEAFVALLIGLTLDDPAWTRAGAWGLLAMVALGAVIFIGRAVVNEVRERRLLAQARGVPNPDEDKEEELPDPFANHVLLKRSLDAPDQIFACDQDAAALRYRVLPGPTKKGRAIADADSGNPLCHVATGRAFTSFSLDTGLPAHIRVMADGREIARLDRRFSLTAPTTQIECLSPQPRHFVIRNQCIYTDNRMIGRIYLLRRALYLDMRRDAFHEAFLAYFALHA